MQQRICFATDDVDNLGLVSHCHVDNLGLVSHCPVLENVSPEFSETELRIVVGFGSVYCPRIWSGPEWTWICSFPAQVTSVHLPDTQRSVINVSVSNCRFTTFSAGKEDNKPTYI